MTSKDLKVNLVNDTIDKSDISNLISWLETNPRLTKGEVTQNFEKQFSNFQNRKYSVFVNSGSSANLAMIYALMLSKRLKNNKIIVPAVSWVTTVSPIIQLGLDPILCDADYHTLGVCTKHLEQLFIEHKPSALMIVNVLGVPNKMDEILSLCSKYGVILLEDSCESIGSTYNNIKTGNFGIMASFSTYFGHHFSTIEGGLVVTDDEELYHILMSIRSHGWSRDLSVDRQKELKEEYNINDFRQLYTFYYPGFNLRSTDLQAFIGINQLEKLDDIIERRNENYNLYHSLIKNSFWKIKPINNNFISNFAYPIITPEVNELAKELFNNGIECRPLICGSMSKQPFWIDLYGKQDLHFADIVHENGLYLPNHPELAEFEIREICNIVNEHIS